MFDRFRQGVASLHEANYMVTVDLTSVPPCALPGDTLPDSNIIPKVDRRQQRFKVRPRYILGYGFGPSLITEISLPTKCKCPAGAAQQSLISAKYFGKTRA